MNVRIQRAVWLAMCLGAVMLAAPLQAEEGSAKADGAKNDQPAKEKRTEPRGRLPNFYGRVVDDSQREQIYKIQQGYKDQVKQLETKIRELRKAMKALKQKQDDQVAAVLSAEQLAEVAKLREAAKQRRAQSRKMAKAKKSSDSQDN